MRYSWHRVSNSIPPKSQGQNSNKLTIRQATPPDEGMYYCAARKESIRVESNRVILKVDGRSMWYESAIYVIKSEKTRLPRTQQQDTLSPSNDSCTY